MANNKKESHYRKKASVKGFSVPALRLAKRNLFVPEDPVKFGMYCHLYLDYYFIEDFLIPEFDWDFEDMYVINTRVNRAWTVKTFFSQAGLYGAYREINHLLIRDEHVSIRTLKGIPSILPKTGLPLFDDRRDKTWRDELEEYLAQKKDYTGEVLDYDRLWSCIERIAVQFVRENF